MPQLQMKRKNKAEDGLQLSDNVSKGFATTLIIIADPCARSTLRPTFDNYYNRGFGFPEVPVVLSRSTFGLPKDERSGKNSNFIGLIALFHFFRVRSSSILISRQGDRED